ncbi:MAG: anaerobic ribonucleoside-triphosphate reductase activating protein [Bacillota bacterium]
MIIGGLEKLTLIDYPDNLAAIVFTQGCNFRCHFCYNPMLVWPRTEKQEPDETHKGQGFPPIKEEDLFLFLEERRGKIDGVVITGGEPTLHADLPEFIRRIKGLGYIVKLDTNGTNPGMLERLIEEGLVDYIAMDLKAPWEHYHEVVGVRPDLGNLQKSVKMIMSCGLPYEFRSTLLPEFHDEEAVAAMGETIAGANRWYLQKFKPDTDLVDTSFQGKNTFTDKALEELALIGSKYVKECRARV